MLCYYIYEEGKQLASEKLGYFHEIWNYLDVSGYLLVVAIIPCHLVRSPSQWIVSALAVVILWVKILGYARGFQNMGPFVRMLFKLVMDVRHFLVLLFLIVVGFALAFNVIVRDTSPDFSNFGLSLFSQYRMIFGDYSVIFDPTLEDLKTQYYGLFVLSRILYVGFSFTVALILLNLLIAIMGNSYATVQANSELEWRWELLEITYEIESNFIWVDKYSVRNMLKRLFRQPIEVKEFNPRWIQVVMSKLNPALTNPERSAVVSKFGGPINALDLSKSMEKMMKEISLDTEQKISNLQSEQKKNLGQNERRLLRTIGAR